MSEKLSKEQVIERLDEISEIKGTRSRYTDSELDEVKMLCKTIMDNRTIWKDFKLKPYFEGHLFNYDKFKSIRNIYLKDKPNGKAAETPKPAAAPKLIDVDEAPKPKTVKPKTGRPLSDVKRVRIATYIDEDLNKKLRIYGALNELKLNDILEEALTEYFSSKPININL